MTRPRASSSSDPTGASDTPSDRTFARARRWRGPLLALSGLRYLVPILALPLVPVLTPEDVGLLTLLRPGKEILLLAGGLTRTRSTPGLAVTFLAYLPLMVGGVWAFFALGRAYAGDLRAGTGPAWLSRAVPPDRLEVAQRVLARRGPAVAVIGRLAALPPTVVAAAAGVSDVSTRWFLVADLVGAVVSFAAVFGIGLALGAAYEQGGPWLTGAGLVLVVGAVLLVSRWLQAEAERE
jgi:membrane protein DedA with SNARE-associated domain